MSVHLDFMTTFSKLPPPQSSTPSSSSPQNFPPPVRLVFANFDGFGVLDDARREGKIKVALRLLAENDILAIAEVHGGLADLPGLEEWGRKRKLAIFLAATGAPTQRQRAHDAPPGGEEDSLRPRAGALLLVHQEFLQRHEVRHEVVEEHYQQILDVYSKGGPERGNAPLYFLSHTYYSAYGRAQRGRQLEKLHPSLVARRQVAGLHFGDMNMAKYSTDLASWGVPLVFLTRCQEERATLAETEMMSED